MVPSFQYYSYLNHEFNHEFLHLYFLPQSENHKNIQKIMLSHTSYIATVWSNFVVLPSLNYI